MYWILRRTGAANFFNSLNNNGGNTSKANYNNNNNNERNVKRPERKAYGRLSVDSDDLMSLQSKLDPVFAADADFAESKMRKSKTLQNTSSNIEDNNLLGQHSPQRDNQKRPTNTLDFNSNDGISWKEKYKQSGGKQQTKFKYQQQKQHEDEDDNEQPQPQQRQPQTQLNSKQGGEPQNLLLTGGRNILVVAGENNENCISRLQPITGSDDDDFDEALTCNVCDRAFHTQSQLASHQQKKRHFGCSECDSLFTSLMLLEHHKDEFEHWSDYDESQIPCCRRNRTEDFGDTDSFTSEAASEDLERLL